MGNGTRLREMANRRSCHPQLPARRRGKRWPNTTGRSAARKDDTHLKIQVRANTRRYESLTLKTEVVNEDFGSPVPRGVGAIERSRGWHHFSLGLWKGSTRYAPKNWTS